MAATASVDVVFDDVPAVPVGAPGAYLNRPGFWYGGAGIAACWYGAAQALAEYLHAAAHGQVGGNPAGVSADAHRLAHLGAVDVALGGAAALLHSTATAIDREPGAYAGRITMRLRLAVENAATEVLSITAAELLPSGRREVIVAPHPDDEVLACGGLLQLLHAQGTHVVLLAVTDGDASHPGSRLLTSEDLCRLRPKETAAAMQAMDINPHILRARIGDGQVRSNLQQLQQLHSLPAPRYRHVFEPACGNGELTAMLSHRADRITASDLSPAAVQLTRQRLGEAALKHVAVRCQRLPQEWPTGANFDLIVISEMAYYLSEAGLHELRGHAVRTLASDSALVLCHWRRPFSDRRLDTDAIHAAFDACPELHNIARHDEADFLLDVWPCSPHSVAQREGGAA